MPVIQCFKRVTITIWYIYSRESHNPPESPKFPSFDHVCYLSGKPPENINGPACQLLLLDPWKALKQGNRGMSLVQAGPSSKRPPVTQQLQGVNMDGGKPTLGSGRVNWQLPSRSQRQPTTQAKNPAESEVQSRAMPKTSKIWTLSKMILFWTRWTLIRWTHENVHKTNCFESQQTRC